MKKGMSIHLILLTGFILSFSTKNYSQTENSNNQINMDSIQKIKNTDSEQQIFIDKFFVPKNAKAEFNERMNINRNFIKKLPGFNEDHVYERQDENGDFHYVTIAVWESKDAIRRAKEAVQAEYKREGFDMPGMLKRLNISIDRAVYHKVVN